jgi:hypothetical protein
MRLWESNEGVRASFTDPSVAGNFILRVSVHEPLLVLNGESFVPGGCAGIRAALAEILKKHTELDVSGLI